MTRQLALFGSAICLVLSTGAASAVDLPIRKPGLWEMKMLRTGGPMPEITMQHCTDETTDKEMSAAASPMAKEVCSKHDVQKTATGYVSDSVCSVAGMTVQGHSEIVGDFNSAYTVKSTSHSEGGAAGTRFWVDTKENGYGVFMIQTWGYKAPTFDVFEKHAREVLGKPPK